VFFRERFDVGGEAVRDRSSSFRICSLAVAGCALALLLGAGSASAGPLSTLKKGDEIDVRDCTYGPGMTHAGRDSGQYLVDRNAFYAIGLVPPDPPGGHFRLRVL